MKMSGIFKLIGAKWKECADKSPYEASAAKDKARYDEEVESYRPIGAEHPIQAQKGESITALQHQLHMLQDNPPLTDEEGQFVVWEQAVSGVARGISELELAAVGSGSTGAMVLPKDGKKQAGKRKKVSVFTFLHGLAPPFLTPPPSTAHLP
jgi:hypothetical protein